LINKLYDLLNPIIEKYIDNNDLIDEFDNLLIKLSYLTKDAISNEINLDFQYTNTNIKKDSSTYWKSGTGYGTNKSIKWDIKNYIQEKETLEQDTTLLLENILSYINSNNIEKINNSCLLNYITNVLNGITLLSIESCKTIIESIMKILDALFEFKELLDITFIQKLITNLKNINDEILILFQNNENSQIIFIYQSIHHNFNKYYNYLTTIDSTNNINNTNNTSTNNSNKEDLYLETMKKLQFCNSEIPNDHIFKTNKDKKLDNKAVVRIISELSSLKSSLPLNYDSTIWMRVPKKDMNIFTFMISGPKDTPYENGLFLFHGCFPQLYPNVEPQVLIMTTGLGKVRFNPNLYANGKVCLSLLGTWSGEEGEKWNSKTSSFLQVLVSIQSLILVEQPYFNEPGYESTMNSEKGIEASFKYNEPLRYHTIELAIIDQIKNPPEEYKEVILNHFKIKKDDILCTCKKWVDESIEYKVKMIEIYSKLEKILNTL
jgi:ubiquitin-protein ligase